MIESDLRVLEVNAPERFVKVIIESKTVNLLEASTKKAAEEENASVPSCGGTHTPTFFLVALLMELFT